ncbi:radical SAM family heme chaperone HemW [Candidatus Babeliales bacterium]|nr:radical SAM family heme chaperone HemW [Candidatus Babeliales bacterium]
MRLKKLKHIYIHWPFCKNKCLYCDFISFKNHEEFVKDYHDALCKQIKLFAENNKDKWKFEIETIFFGGGTPSLYPLDLLKDLFSVLNSNFNLEDVKEVTIEVNPVSVIKEHLKTWKNLGINRLSIGVQILDEIILQKLNRIQPDQDVFNLVKIVPDYFENISVDLILGLPGTTLSKWSNTLKKIVLWPIKHISVYFLTTYDKTPLFYKVKNKDITLFDENDLISFYELTVDFLKDNGFEQYEISNFAKPGFESIHNKAYWDRKPYQGFGLSASSFDGKFRFVNEKNLLRFIKCCNQKYEKLYCYQEKLSKDEEFLERLMLGLRQKKGIDLHRMLYFLKGEKKNKFLNVLIDLEKRSLIHNRGGKIYLTLKGIMLENEVILKLI